MIATITGEQRQAAKRQIIEHIKYGASVQEARTAAAVSMHRTTMYRLLRRTQAEGQAAFSDGRHGHPVKLRGEVRTFLIDFCRAFPSVSSPALQTALLDRFGLTISVSQHNRVRAALGLRSPGNRGEKKSSEITPPEPEWHESAGSLLLLAAAIETSLLTQFSQALPPEMIQPPSSHHPGGLSSCHRLLLTLLFLRVVELRRTWDLRSYTGDGLARLSARKRAYGYRYTEEFLARVAQAGSAERLTDILARWTAQLWNIQDTSQEALPSAFYVDGHRKPVYTDVLIPRGLVGRLSTVLGSRTLILLHDAQGHPLLATTYRGDLHLTSGLPCIIERYEQATGPLHLERLVVDREGMATELLATLQTAGRTVVTLLRSPRDAQRDHS